MLERAAHGVQPRIQRRLLLDALVGPVRGQAFFGHLVHAFGPYLHFQAGALGILYGNVKGFVPVRLGVGYPVAEPGGVRLVLLRHESEDLPAQCMLHRAVLLAIDDEADGEHVIDSVEIDFLLLHLLPDGESGLGAGLELVFDAGFRELCLERLDELCGDELAVAFCGFKAIGDGAVLLGFGIFEVDVLHLALHIVQAELVGQGNVEHQGLELFPLARSLGEQVEAAHDLEAVSEL